MSDETPSKAKQSSETEDTRRPFVLGVRIVYCVDGEKKEAWVDMDKVKALAWTEGKIGSRGENPGHGYHLPTTNQEPGDCPPMQTMAAGQGICWWTGSAWVCGD
jgi:hypothetical protein